MNSDRPGRQRRHLLRGLRIAKFIHGTNTAVAVADGGDAICRAQNYNQRLDVADARAFLGRYLQLP